MGLSHFNLDHEVKTSMDMGVLIPIYWRDVMPGDEIRLKSRYLLRTMPFIAPVMHKLDAYVRYYYVPYRLLAKDFTEIIMQKDDDPRTFPTFAKKEFSLGHGSLFDYFGIHGVGDKISADVMAEISRMPFLAYYLIYNYFYKDPLLDPTYDDNLTPEKLSRLLDDEIVFPKRINWSPDYFTAARTTTQYGDEVDLDMDGNSVIKVNEMRMAEKLQRFKEKLLMSSTYIEFIKSFFPAYPKDFAVQRPKLLGSYVETLNITDVDQTAPSEHDPVGNLAGKCVNVATNLGYRSEFEEHGIVLGLMFVKPRQSYMAGVPRMFFKKDGFSMALPHFANLGMQDVRESELNASSKDPKKAWAYQERYAEMKYPVDVVCGEFAKLQFWHFCRDIRKEKLSNDFLKCIPTDAPFAVRRSILSSLDFGLFLNNNDKSLSLVFKDEKDRHSYAYNKTGLSGDYNYTDLDNGDVDILVYLTDGEIISSYDNENEYQPTQGDIVIWRKSKPDLYLDINGAISQKKGINPRTNLFDVHYSVEDFKSIDYNNPTYTSFKTLSKTYDPIMVSMYHNEDALRPLPKIYSPSIL